MLRVTSKYIHNNKAGLVEGLIFFVPLGLARPRGEKEFNGWSRSMQDRPNYFITHGYGQHNHTESEIREMFHEMDAMGMLFPMYGNMKMVDCYSKRRKRQHRYWFKHRCHKAA